jgi:lipopolysaccharide heptosyltransferase I
LSQFLIVRLGSLGDVVHGIPVAAALRREFPHGRVDWMVDPRYTELLDLVEVVDRSIPIDPRDAFGNSWRGFFDTIRELRHFHYDAVIDLQGLLKSAALARAVGARRTIGFPRAHLRERFASLLYSETPDPGTATHVVYKNLALLAALGVQDRRPQFPIAVRHSAIVESVLSRLPDGYVLINPGAAWPNKQWPAARFGATAASIHQSHGLRSLVLWGPGEQSLAHDVVAASGGAADVAPPTTIVDLVGVARAARLMISGDTGPMHIAAAVGTPLVTLFGPTRPERNGPWGPYDIALSRVEQCRCLYERRCRLDRACITDITVDEVVQAINRRLAVHA